MNAYTAPKVATCLWYDDDAEQAAELYTSLLPNSHITSRFRHGPENTARVVDFTLAGVPYQALNGGPDFKHSEAASIVVQTQDQRETDFLWDRLTANGGSESQCGWLKDRFGLSWQIVPRPFAELLTSSDRDAVNRMVQAMMQMRKLDLAALESAFSSGASR